MNSVNDDIILEVNNLRMHFPVTKGLLRRKIGDIKAVDNVSFKIKRGQTLGLVGESGCGKTTIGRCILRVYRPTEGQIIFEGQNLARLSPSKMRPLRNRVQLVFQDPYGSLDPRQNAGSIVGESLKIFHMYNTKREYNERLEELFTLVGLNPQMTDRYPHEFSGGQRQRIGIARALSCEPSFIVCDEPVSALDVSIQSQIINLLQTLQRTLNLTYLFIAHDLSVVRRISDHVAVLYLGRIVEIADWQEIYENPLHPYTRALLSAVPIPDPIIEKKRERIILQGDVPSPLNLPDGCTFHPRCSMATDECRQAVPAFQRVTSTHQVACIKVNSST